VAIPQAPAAKLAVAAPEPKPVIAPADAAKPTVVAKPAAPAKPAAAAPTTDPTESPVVGRGGAAIPSEAVSSRLERERNKLLRAEYGTTDPAEIKRIKDLRAAQDEEYKRLKADRDEADRAAMSEQERMKADMDRITAENNDLRTKLHEMETGQIVSQQTQELMGIARKYIDETMIEYALADFQRYVNKLDPKEVKRITPRSIERWFTKLAEEKPRFKIVAPAPQAADVSTGTSVVGSKGADAPGPGPATIVSSKAVRRVPISTSNVPKGGATKPTARTPTATTPAGKTARPGKPNSMSKAELNQHLRSKGIQPW
jgi:hypothetical protein